MEAALSNIFWALIASITLVCFVALGVVVDKATNNKLGDFIIKMFER